MKLFSKDYYNTDLAKELFNKKTLTYKEIVEKKYGTACI